MRVQALSFSWPVIVGESLNLSEYQFSSHVGLKIIFRVKVLNEKFDINF